MQTATFPRLARLEAIEEGAAAFYRFARTARRPLRPHAPRSPRPWTFSTDDGRLRLRRPDEAPGHVEVSADARRPRRDPPHVPEARRPLRPGHAGGPHGRVSASRSTSAATASASSKTSTRGWMEAMIPGRDFCATGVQFYALQVTGGEPGRPTRGLNVVITGAGERAALMLDRDRSGSPRRRGRGRGRAARGAPGLLDRRLRSKSIGAGGGDSPRLLTVHKHSAPVVTFRRSRCLRWSGVAIGALWFFSRLLTPTPPSCDSSLQPSRS